MNASGTLGGWIMNTIRYQEIEQILEIICLAPPKPKAANREQPYLALQKQQAVNLASVIIQQLVSALMNSHS